MVLWSSRSLWLMKEGARSECSVADSACDSAPLSQGFAMLLPSSLCAQCLLTVSAKLVPRIRPSSARESSQSVRQGLGVCKQ